MQRLPRGLLRPASARRSTPAGLLGAALALTCCLAPALCGSSTTPAASDQSLRLRVQHYSTREGGQSAQFLFVATVENLAAFGCEYDLVLVGTDPRQEIVFQESVGSVRLGRFEEAEVEITAEIPLELSRRVTEVDFLTRSQCDLRYGDQLHRAEVPALQARREIRTIYAEQRDLWRRRHSLLQSLPAAEKAPDSPETAAILEEIAEIDAQLQRNDRRRNALR